MGKLSSIDTSEIIKGAKFYRCDLHIHTSTSLDFLDKSTTNEQIIDKCVSEGLDLVAITDHNDVGDIDELIKLGKDKGITVLPGIEVSVDDGKAGIHVLAIFPETISRGLMFDFLASVGINEKVRGKEDALTDCNIHNTFEKIDKYGGLCIPAHIENNKGLTNDLRGQSRIKIITSGNIDALEITESRSRTYFDGTNHDYKYVKIPCIQSSDAHSLDEIGTRITRLKMEKPSFEGIKQAFIDWESRIRFEDELNIPVPKIISLKVMNGFLDGVNVNFNDNLNCLIGGRGVGKSTFIELLRYVLNSPPTTETVSEES